MKGDLTSQWDLIIFIVNQDASYVCAAQLTQLEEVEAPVVVRYVPATQLTHIVAPVPF
jgi:hypothetical protein